MISNYVSHNFISLFKVKVTFIGGKSEFSTYSASQPSSIPVRLQKFIYKQSKIQNCPPNPVIEFHPSNDFQLTLANLHLHLHFAFRQSKAMLPMIHMR